jgi:hypothetical protein
MVRVAGAVIPAALLTGLRSDLPGQVTAAACACAFNLSGSINDVQVEPSDPIRLS